MTIPTLQYDRQTIKLAFELKRTLPLDDQADFKISNPDFVSRVKEIYQATTKKKTKDLAEEFLGLVGEPVKSSKLGLLAAYKNLDLGARLNTRLTSISQSK
ncbi:hypothetical protein [Arenicella sp. 4NH20-0111]|uniref:hypothetical protein n=1 Tax=Arenicella sp. 4NH20-0111 TaxID=3127648 RepID=UPI003341BC2B